jgi:hypothetical protein
MNRKSLLMMLLGLLLFVPELMAQANDSLRVSLNIRRLRETQSVVSGDTLWALIFNDANIPLADPVAANRVGIVSANQNDTVYTGVFRMGSPATRVYPYRFTWKFVYRNGARGRTTVFESISDRSDTLLAAGTRTLPARYWDNDATRGFAPKLYRVRFNANVDSLVINGFSASADTLFLGLFGGYDSINVITPTTRVPASVGGQTDGVIMARQGSTSAYSAEIVIRGTPGGRLTFKYRGLPLRKFGGSAYEPADDRTVILPATGGATVLGRPLRGADVRVGVASANNDTITLDVVRPELSIPAQNQAQVSVVFRVNLSGRRLTTGQSIDSLRQRGLVRYVVLFGSIEPIGNFAGPWDTTNVRPQNPTGLVRLTPVAAAPNDSIWQATVVIPAGTPGAGSQFAFKYGVFWTGIPTTGNYLDNSAGFGQDNTLTLPVTNRTITFTVNTAFGASGAVPSSGILDVKRDENAPTPTTFALSQNYPNPFNPSTAIRFVIPTNESVQLEVYNLLGQKVASLINQRLVAGTYNVQFNATPFASGVYFYRLRAGNFLETKKMMLVK